MQTLTIGQVANQTGIRIETIRFYEREGLLEEPARGQSGYRQYPPEVVHRIQFIKRAKHLGFTLKEIKELLSLKVAADTTCCDIKQQAEIKIADISAKIQDLERMKQTLVELTFICEGSDPLSNCPILGRWSYRTIRMFTLLNQYRRVINSRTYFPLWLGQLVSNFGDTLNYVALVVLIYQLTNSGLAVSLTVIFEILPVLILGPAAGVVIDRFPRKVILIASDLVRAVLAFSLILAHEPWQVYVVAAGMVAAGVFFNPTFQAILPTLVEADSLLAANSIAWSTGRLVQIIGSALAGGLIASIGTGSAFGVNAFSFLFSAVMISQVDIPTKTGKINQTNLRGLDGWWRDIQVGLRYARQDHFISRLVLVQALSSLAVGATSALLVVLAEQHLQLSPAGFSWLLLAIGVGALLGPILFGSMVRNYRSAWFLFIPYIIRGLGDILIAFFTPLPVALFLLFIYGLNTSTGMVVYNSLLQSAVPEKIRGRVFTLLDIVWNTMRLISLGIGGLLVEQWGIQTVYYLGGTLLILAGILGLILLQKHTFNSPQNEAKIPS